MSLKIRVTKMLPDGPRTMIPITDEYTYYYCDSCPDVFTCTNLGKDRCAMAIALSDHTKPRVINKVRI
jgi:hypothetical protein